MSCNGEVHTQADWAAQATGIQAGLSLIGDSAENMLRSLDARHAGRDHMRLAAEWADQVHSCITFGTSVITEVNTRQDPYVGAVQAAGGSAEVADPAYYDEM